MKKFPAILFLCLIAHSAWAQDSYQNEPIKLHFFRDPNAAIGAVRIEWPEVFAEFKDIVVGYNIIIVKYLDDEKSQSYTRSVYVGNVPEATVSVNFHTQAKMICFALGALFSYNGRYATERTNEYCHIMEE